MTDQAKRTPTADERFNRISEDGLCIGCGLCQSLAGPERIRMTITPAGEERPVIQQSLDAALVDQIYDVCPGTRVEGLPEVLLEDDTAEDKVWGSYQKLVLAYAADPEVRFLGATGGVLTALAIYLLESGRVDFVLHATASKVRPSFGERHLSFTRADVLAGAGSRYGPTATLIDVGEVLSRGQPFAFVGTPCDISALRNLAHHDGRMNELVRYWLTPVCGGFMPPPMMRDFLAGLGIGEEEVTALSYRGKGCPGPTRIETRDGRAIEKDYLDLWGEDEGAWSLPFRCKVCPDGIGEAADIAASDTWPGGSPTREGQAGDKGTNGVIARTAAGRELLAAAARDGALTVERDITMADMSLYQPHQVAKKMAVWARYAGLKAAGQLVPQTKRLRIAELAREAGLTANLMQARGSRRRAKEGRNREPTPRSASDKT